jgi:hypothetical protein
VHIQAEPPDKYRVDVFKENEKGNLNQVGYYLKNGENEYIYKIGTNEYASKDQIENSDSGRFSYYDRYAPLRYFPGTLRADLSKNLISITDETLYGLSVKHVVWSDPDTPGGQRNAWFTVKEGVPVQTAYVETTKGKSTPTEFSLFKLSSASTGGPIPDSVFNSDPPQNVFIEPMPGIIAAGKTARDFSAVDLLSNRHKMSDLKGMKLILFWSSWSKRSALAIDEASDLFRRADKTKLSAIAVDEWDEKTNYELWMLNHQSEMFIPVYFDPAAQTPEALAQNIALTTYGLKSLPVFVVVGQDNKISLIQEYSPDALKNVEDALNKMGVNFTPKTK